MLQSRLTVVSPALSVDLTVLANVKAELGLTSSAEDAAIETYIDQASAICAAYCNRVFAQETVTETFRNRSFWSGPSSTLPYMPRSRLDVLVLQRFPVTTFTSIVEDGTTLVQDTDYEADLDTGRIYRLLNDSLTNWRFDKLVVTYTGGYALLGALPYNIERACITMVKLLRSNAARDPALKSENILSGLYSYSLFGPNDMPNGIPADVQALLDPYRNVTV